MFKEFIRARPSLLQQELTRPDWTVSASRSHSLLWLDKNENTDEDYLNIVKNAILKNSVNDINNYPDCSVLYKKLAKQLNISPHNLLLGAGSDGIIRYAFETFVSPGDAVVYTKPTFAMYSVYSDIFAAKSCPVVYQKSEEGPTLDLAIFLKTIHDEKPTLVCLPNSDSPTGTLLAEDKLILLIEACAKVNAVLLIDEAYYPYSEYTALPLIQHYPNLIIARTFSKAWGLAGARVGYAVGDEEIIRIMHKVRPMYEIGAVSAGIVTDVLDFENDMLASVKRINDGKTYFVSEMEKLGFKTINTIGNFQHVSFGDKTDTIDAALNDVVLYRKDFPETALEGFSRFSATTVFNFTVIVNKIKNAL